MAALQDYESQVQVASTLPHSEIPIKFRCASCDQLAIFAWKLICCDQIICQPCHASIDNKCPLCEHSPLDKTSCIESKSMRNSVKVLLKKYLVKEENGSNPEATPAPVGVTATPAGEPEITPLASVGTDEVAPSHSHGNIPAGEGSNNDTDLTLLKPEAGQDSQVKVVEDEDAQAQSEVESDSSSVEIHIGDANNQISKPTYGANSVTTKVKMEPDQSSGGNQQESDPVQSGGSGNDQNQGMMTFNGMNFDPARFQQMQRMMMQAGMPNMNMMNMQGMGGMNPMMMPNMFNNGFNNYGMNGMQGMQGMNMGMNMGYGNMGFGGNFNGQVNGNFGGNGYYPNGGYNPRQMHNAQFSNQYQRGFRRGNYQQNQHYQQRGNGRGYQSHNNYYDQQSYQGDRGTNDVTDSIELTKSDEPTEKKQSDDANDTTGHKDATTEHNFVDADSHQDSSMKEPDSAAIPSVETSTQAFAGHEGEAAVLHEPSNMMNEQTQQYSQAQDQFRQYPSQEQNQFQNSYGPSGRGRPFARGHGGWRGRGSFNGYGSNSYAQSGAAVTLVSSAPPENAPTGPRAMREANAAPFGGRGGPRAPPTGPATYVQPHEEYPSNAVDTQAHDRSRTRSRSRSPPRSPSVRDDGETRGHYRERSYSDHGQDYDRAEDKTSYRTSHQYDEEVAYHADEGYKARDRSVNYPRDASVDSSRHRSSRRDKDKHRSSRSHRDRSRESKHKRRRSRSPEYHNEDAGDLGLLTTTVEDEPSSETSYRRSKGERHRDRDGESSRDKEKRRDKDRYRDRSRDHKRKRSRRDRTASPRSDDSDSEDRHRRSSRRSRKDKKARHRGREDDKHYDKYYDSKRHSEKHYEDKAYDEKHNEDKVYNDKQYDDAGYNDKQYKDTGFNDKQYDDNGYDDTGYNNTDHGNKKYGDDNAYDETQRATELAKHEDGYDSYDERKSSQRYDHDQPSTYEQSVAVVPTDDIGFSILGRSGNRNMADTPPSGPATMRPPPTGPRAQGQGFTTQSGGPSANHYRRASESSNRSRPHTPATPVATSPAIDPYQAEREKRNRERMAREQQRGMKHENEFAPPTGPRRRH